MVDDKQLERLLEIADDNTTQCYNEHINKFGPKKQQCGKNFSLTELYESELAFLHDIREQEGLRI